MKIRNCNYHEFEENIDGKKIIIFGIGDYFHYYMSENVSPKFKKNVVYFIDNALNQPYMHIWNQKIPIYKPEKLKEENDCIVVLASTNYMNEMYNQLENMHLNDGIYCYAYPLIMVNTIGKSETLLKERIFKCNSNMKIPKEIHSFWFSGDTKPEAYQKCIDSWKKFCPDYKIHEWNMDNYDYTKSHFMKQAIENKKWAFVSDFARLDVLYQNGGIYMDMDVEVIRPLDNLLGIDAFFTFDVNMDIDLGTFASIPQNNLLRKFMKIYEDIEFSGDMKTMNQLCQPRHIRPVLKDHGVKLNGDMQIINNMVFFPRNYLAPKDSIIYELSALSSDTYTIHHYNAGWKNDDYRNSRMLNNKKIWNIVKEYK